MDIGHIKGKITNKFFNVDMDTSVKFDPIIGFKEIKINNYTIVADEKHI
jgi:hypothetical protein